MRLPSARTAVGTYVALIALGTIPHLTGIPYEGPRWALVASSLPVVLAPAALFVATIAIDALWAFAVPVVALVMRAAIIHEFGYTARHQHFGLEDVTLRSDLWTAIKAPVLVAVIVVAVAFFIARMWEPWISEDRILKPEVRWPAIVLVGGWLVSVLLDIAVVRTGFFHGYIPGLLTDLASATTIISFCLLCAISLSPWVLPIPLFLVFESVIAIVAAPQFSCDDGDCKEFLWPLLRDTLIIWVAAMLISLAAGWWSQRGGEEPDSDLELRPEDHGALTG